MNSSKDKPVEADFFPDIKNYHLLTKVTIGDALGNFEFDNISDGEFYVLTEIHWIVDKYWLPEGGYLIERIPRVLTRGQTGKFENLRFS